VSDLDSPFRSGDPRGWQGAPRSVQDLTARAQRLIDLPRPVGGYPLEWHIEALHVGDLTAIAMAGLRSPDSK
jgi:hypothetical protein